MGLRGGVGRDWQELLSGPMESWNGEQGAGSKGEGRIGANVDSNPRPR